MNNDSGAKKLNMLDGWVLRCPSEHRSPVVATRRRGAALYVLLSAVSLIVSTAFASDYPAYPSWWTAPGGVIDRSVAVTNDYAVFNQGQLKWIASKARDHFNAYFPGGAGAAIDSVVNGFTMSNNYLAVNAGQLKNIAKLYYDRMIDVGLTNAYPWASSMLPADDFAAVNVGQLKNLFNFDFSVDADSDGMPNEWERDHGLNPFSAQDAGQSNVNPWAHGLSNLQVYRNPSVLLADNYSSLSDEVPDWWKVKYGLGLLEGSVVGGDPDHEEG